MADGDRFRDLSRSTYTGRNTRPGVPPGEVDHFGTCPRAMFLRKVTAMFKFSKSLFAQALILAGCQPVPVVMTAGDSTDQGGGGLAFQLPLARGVEKICTQGVGGSRSHSSDSTYYDIDLDTDNNSQEELYAPASGIARVHMESATSGFGYHICIDLGNGTYFVIAHCSAIFVSDGEEVAVGQLLAYEGNTGNSSGDHVHIGLHRGDAGQTADHGVSIPTFYFASNQSTGADAYNIASEDFSCGLASQGDAQDGDFYESQLATTLWHPDGTLVKTPDNARVYVVGEGRARWIQNEEVFWAMDYSFGEVVLVSSEELSCLGEGEDILSPINVPQYDGLREGDLLKETDASDVYVVMGGRALPIESWDVYLLMRFNDRTITVLPPGTVESTLQMGNCAADVWCLDAEAVTTCGGGLELSGDGQGGEPGDDDAQGDDDTTPAGDDDDSQGDDDTTPASDDDDDTQEESSSSVLTVSVDYPTSYPQLTLTVQPVFAVSQLGQGWNPVQPSVFADDEVIWSQSDDWSGIIGVRFNVNVDSDGNGTADDWYCYGHYTTAFLEYGVSAQITLGGDEWDENDLVTWSPGTQSQTELGCSVLLWFGNVSTITVGYVQ